MCTQITSCWKSDGNCSTAYMSIASIESKKATEFYYPAALPKTQTTSPFWTGCSTSSIVWDNAMQLHIHFSLLYAKSLQNKEGNSPICKTVTTVQREWRWTSLTFCLPTHFTLSLLLLKRSNDVGKKHPYWRVTPGKKLNWPLRKQSSALASSKTTQIEDLFYQAWTMFWVFFFSLRVLYGRMKSYYLLRFQLNLSAATMGCVNKALRKDCLWVLLRIWISMPENISWDAL